VARVEEAACLAAARRLQPTRPWSGFVVDVELPDGSGLHWLEDLRRRGCSTPALVMTGLLDRAVVNHACRLNAWYACKPLPIDELMLFAETAGRDHSIEARTAAALGKMSVDHGLSPRELEIVGAHFRGIARDEFLALRDISINTYKTQVKSILRKLSQDSLNEVRDELARVVFGSPAGGD
jgi:DNA-binding NarL/FixJ family response regulator